MRNAECGAECGLRLAAAGLRLRLRLRLEACGLRLEA